MKKTGRMLWLALGMVLGGVAVWLWLGHARQAQAATLDRYDDFIMCTGTVSVLPRSQTDGVWLLDYRAGKLLGTIVDRNNNGKVLGWAEVDLVKEFGLQPRANVHFMMTTGQITQSQAVLYVAETSSGKFAVYSMGPRPDNQPGLTIRRHDMSSFRQPPPQPQG